MPKSNGTVLELKFDLERYTKNTGRFREDAESEDTAAIGTLYVQKSTLSALGNPSSLKVKLEAGS